MKKILFNTGALLLVAAGVFAGKKAFTTDATALYFTSSFFGTGVCEQILTGGTGTALLTTGASNANNLVITHGGVNYTAYSTSACGANHHVRFVP